MTTKATTKATKKLFGSRPLTGAGPLVHQLLQGISQYNWEAAWPGIQKALAGLSIATIAAIKGEAIARGLSELANAIASDPMINVGGVQEGSESAFYSPQVGMPYIPLSPTMRAQPLPGESPQEFERREAGESYWREALREAWEGADTAITQEEADYWYKRIAEAQQGIVNDETPPVHWRDQVKKMVPYNPASPTMRAQSPSEGEARQWEDYYRRLLERLATETDPIKRKEIEEELDKAYTERMSGIGISRAMDSAPREAWAGWENEVGAVLKDIRGFQSPRPPHDPCSRIRALRGLVKGLRGRATYLHGNPLPEWSVEGSLLRIMNMEIAKLEARYCPGE